MAKKYDLSNVTETHNRLSDPDLTESEMEAELEAPSWIPVLSQMIAIADSETSLADSERYGMFLRINDKGRYVIGTGNGKYARPLTPAEIANCF